ncbi:MAG: 30S ribosomal protein S18 [Alphaproteobacteria bacterium CG_4_10_14_0_8_um_filter_37_21]|jgi:small subunit ribosomal protein S18|nr:MAG: 30S ribosomal protein S18 [Alphaproteobacteria bacterium CG_4_10_14_0_8_um_filter_37_21]
MSDRPENSNDRNQEQRPLMVKRQFFRRRKSCPFTGPKAMVIDYKDIRTLSKFVSERGKMTPSRISSVSAKKQRALATAVKRARYLALMPYVNT